jgi:hypothetical protein
MILIKYITLQLFGMYLNNPTIFITVEILSDTTSQIYLICRNIIINKHDCQNVKIYKNHQIIG